MVQLKTAIKFDFFFPLEPQFPIFIYIPKYALLNPKIVKHFESATFSKGSSLLKEVYKN